MIRNLAAILAGGIGKRAGFSVPKQFTTLCGRTVLERSVDKFEENDNISDIVIVSCADYIAQVQDMAAHNGWRKFRGVVAGGRERSDSTRAALRACAEGTNNILLHDAARPLVSRRIIDEVCAALEHYGAVNVAVPSVDSLVEVSDGRMLRALDRALVWRVQTPQAFRLDIIRRAYDLATGDPHFFATDDCSVVKKYLPDTEIAVVRGEESNIKLTYADDVSRMEDILRRKSE